MVSLRFVVATTTAAARVAPAAVAGEAQQDVAAQQRPFSPSKILELLSNVEQQVTVSNISRTCTTQHSSINFSTAHVLFFTIPLHFHATTECWKYGATEEIAPKHLEVVKFSWEAHCPHLPSVQVTNMVRQ